ncbi:patatin-like phospholipase family protein [Phenylobacterium sp. J367]|uniref:patatin-like phospholipase family protein n=1 Tax=Phenylobacterium sp. J367 TaxID=2898435 RepID=UPI002151372C|nr:patatin-like phospholipase family protein [Phenylobacterium sp. J367]MCR5878560.1 patatin-like phospholipase family protein [Phenylobacterium sp. J367]
MTTRALVLGGGGPVGIAWESGLIAGFAQAGVDLSQADFIMGTSAGSFVGARLALGADPKTLADPVLRETQAGRAPSGGAPAALGPLVALMAEARGGKRNPAEVRAEIGAFALHAETMDEDAFLATFGRSFAGQTAWPARDFACTAVDAEDGGFRLWTAHAGAPLDRAVASSCSVPGVYPPVTIDGRRYIDGGMRSSTNADLAAGYDLVVIVAVRLGDETEIGRLTQAQLEAEVDSLQEGGASVVVIGPDDGSLAALGPNLMDFTRRPDAARAGLAQAAGQAEILKGVWG